ncbi:MAG: carboxypeptidase M32 [Cellulosilyticaceae bacterium]
MEVLQGLKEQVKKIGDYRHAAMILSWDMETHMPKKGADAHISALTTLSGEAFKMSVSEEMRDQLEALRVPERYKELDAVDQAMVEHLYEEYLQCKNIPSALYERYVETSSRSQNTWLKAKHEADFDKMKPYFEEMIALQKEMAHYINPTKDPYDVLLDTYEKGITADKITDLFDALKEGTVPLIEAIGKKGIVDEQPFVGDFDKVRQQTFAHYLLDVMGYDLEAGRLDESEHPFTIGEAPYDVRITTHYDLRDIRSSAFSVIHEGGHAIYEQQIMPKLIGTGLATGTSMGIHESQSRFFENIIGRSKAFWTCHYPKVQEIFPQFKQMDLETFYKGNNIVKPSLIRTEADELTYNLHVIIRFELERDLFSGKLAVADLPEAWHAKMKHYLGVVPTSHTDGVLQDTHWPSGMFGYFPSYALGNIYGGQFLEALVGALGPIETLIHEGRLDQVRAWLGKHIHQYGKMKTPTQIVEELCGTGLDAQPIIRYYTKKYSQIYEL